MNPGMDGTRVPLSYRLSSEEVVELDLSHPVRMEGWREFCDTHIDQFVHPGTRYVCAAGLRSFHIDPYGHLGICVLSREPKYNLRVGTFDEGWEVLGETRGFAGSQTQ